MVEIALFVRAGGRLSLCNLMSHMRQKVVWSLDVLVHTIVTAILHERSPAPLPKGGLTLARQFTAGSRFAIALVPEGRLNRPMSYVSSYYHCVFSTKERRPAITAALQERLWPFLDGIARENKMQALAVGEIADHVHLLLSLPATTPVAESHATF
jgi:hypothetical protein